MASAKDIGGKDIRKNEMVNCSNEFLRLGRICTFEVRTTDTHKMMLRAAMVQYNIYYIAHSKLTYPIHQKILVLLHTANRRTHRHDDDGRWIGRCREDMSVKLRTEILITSYNHNM